MLAIHKISKARYIELCDRWQRFQDWHTLNSGPYYADEVPANARITNDEWSAIEVYEFIHDKPDRYFCYVNEKERKVTTWTGDILAHHCVLGSPFHVFNAERRSIRFKAINGRIYYGWYFSGSGDYARVKATKES